MNRILREIEEQLEQIFAMVFENYKSLDESSASGIMEFFGPATGIAAHVLNKLYSLLHDILPPEAQNKLYSYFQRSRRHLSETDEYVSGNNEGLLMDVVGVSTAYQKMKSMCLNIRNEIFTDIEIHNQHINSKGRMRTFCFRYLIKHLDHKNVLKYHCYCRNNRCFHFSQNQSG